MNPKKFFYWCLRSVGMFALGRFLTRRQLKIICYHAGAIGDQSDFNPKLFYPNGLLQSRLQWLRRKGFHPVSLNEATSRLTHGAGFAARSVALTVDDGWYSSKRTIIDPAIAAGFPVALYVATEVLRLQIPVIDVTVRYILWKSPSKRVSISKLDGIPAGNYALADRGDRQRLEDAAVAWCKALSADKPAAVGPYLKSFAGAVGVSEAQLDLESRRFSYLTSRELLDLQSGGCAIELHGHQHKYFFGRPDLVEQDIVRCRDILIALGVPSPSHYCYPSGEHDAMASEILQRLGVVSATTCRKGFVGSDGKGQLHYLPRFLDGGNVSMIEFEAEMSGISELARLLGSGIHRLVPRAPRAGV